MSKKTYDIDSTISGLDKYGPGPGSYVDPGMGMTETKASIQHVSGGGKPSKSAYRKPVFGEIPKGYMEIPKSEWKKIDVGTYVRYFDQNGDWREGANVKMIDDEKIYMSKLGGHFSNSKYTKKIEVPFSEIKSLWMYVKTDDSRSFPTPSPKPPKPAPVPKVGSAQPAPSAPSPVSAYQPSIMPHPQPVMSTSDAFGAMSNKIIDNGALEMRIKALEEAMRKVVKHLATTGGTTAKVVKVLQDAKMMS